MGKPVSEGIDYPCPVVLRCEIRIWPVDMDMTVEMVRWLKHPVQPAECFYTLMRQVGLVMNAPGGGMGDKYVKETPEPQPV